MTLEKQGVSATGVLIDDSDTRFAYQFSAGIGVDLAQLGFGPIGPMRNSTIEIGYRRFEVSELTFAARDGTTTTTELSADLFTVGFRRNF